MANAHLHMTVQSMGTRKKDGSPKSPCTAISKAAYIACAKLENLDGLKMDYRKKQGLVFSELITHDGHKANRQAFWADVERKALAIRKDAVLSREMNISLPHELDAEAQIELAREFARWIMERYHLAGVDLAIHNPPEKTRDPRHTSAENVHAHILFPDRGLILDKRGRGNATGLSRNKDELKAIRAAWEEIHNRHIRAAGLDASAEISMKSYESQLAKAEEEAKCLEAELMEREKKREQEREDARRREADDRNGILAAKVGNPEHPSGIRGSEGDDPAPYRDDREIQPGPGRHKAKQASPGNPGESRVPGRSRIRVMLEKLKLAIYWNLELQREKATLAALEERNQQETEEREEHDAQIRLTT